MKIFVDILVLIYHFQIEMMDSVFFIGRVPPYHNIQEKYDFKNFYFYLFFSLKSLCVTNRRSYMCLFSCVCIQKVGQPRVCKVGKSLFSNLILTCFTYFLCASKMFKHIDDLLLVTYRDLSGKNK